jgi:hypothetical protein
LSYLTLLLFIYSYMHLKLAKDRLKVKL